MEATDVALVAGFVVLYALVSKRLEPSIVSGPMVFVTFGIVMGSAYFDVVQLEFDDGFVAVLAEVTLALVLFTDATRVDLRELRKGFTLPGRMLAIGLPVSIVLGLGASLLLLPDLVFWEAALLAAILAPTDAALGQAIVTSPAIPVRIRQAVNVESGLNDGIAAPVVTLFVALAAVELSVRDPAYWLRFAAEQIGLGVLVGIAVGYSGAWAIDRATTRGWVSRDLQQIGTLALAIVAYAGATGAGGNGFVAAFIGGLVFGIVARPHCAKLEEFTEEEGQLLTLLTFLVFGASIAGPAIQHLDWRIAIYALLSLTVVRMAAIAASLLGARLQPATVGLLGWFGPRGLASIVFGITALETADLPGGHTIELTMAATVLLSIFAHGMTADPLTRWYSRHYGRLAEGIPDLAENEPVADLPARYPMRD